MPLHPAWVKNISRRVLWAALEADITKKDRLAMVEYFNQRCAYCDGELPSRWHADHLIPVDKGGFNHVSNRVPACPPCNEREKQDLDWLPFLTLKCGGQDSAVLATRRQRIQAWTSRNAPGRPPVTEEQRQAWRKEVAEVARAIDSAWDRLKASSPAG